MNYLKYYINQAEIKWNSNVGSKDYIDFLKSQDNGVIINQNRK